MSQRPISIAYVEDNLADIAALRTMLDEWHIVNPLVTYPDGGALFCAFSDGAAVPGIVLVDMALPGGQDGMDIVRALRQEHPPGLDGIALVIVTGSDAAASIELAKRAGADAYIVKPMGVPALMKAINQAAPFVLEIVRYDRRLHARRSGQ